MTAKMIPALALAVLLAAGCKSNSVPPELAAAGGGEPAAQAASPEEGKPAETAKEAASEKGAAPDKATPGKAKPVGGFQPLKLQARQTWDARRTLSKYGRKPGDSGPRVFFEEARAMPGWIKPGGLLDTLVQYAVVDAFEQDEVTELRHLLRDGQPIAELSRVTAHRENGTWITTQQVMVPLNLPRGDYAVRYTIECGGQSVSGDAPFSVGAR